MHDYVVTKGQEEGPTHPFGSGDCDSPAPVQSFLCGPGSILWHEHACTQLQEGWRLLDLHSIHLQRLALLWVQAPCPAQGLLLISASMSGRTKGSKTACSSTRVQYMKPGAAVLKGCYKSAAEALLLMWRLPIREHQGGCHHSETE